ncbi:MAG: cytochrome c oxidase subunit 3 [Firmicutes bacterium]|jgi:heme/copper-type cytochrome/quinol oxidase subunit 3|nr:cytochrome c oxidase subunit 3 [Bacillota bacterium]
MSLPVDPKVIPKPPVPLEFSVKAESIKITGFWMFLVSDMLIFASLFSVFAVFRSRIMAGPTPNQIFHYGSTLLETLLLLTSSFTVGMAIFAMRKSHAKVMMAWLVLTLVLGAGFVATEIHEFVTDVQHGITWHVSGFLSGFFVLVGTHGAHVSFGIAWAVTLLFQLSRRGLTPVTSRKLYTFSLYWHFLDIVWVFIFTFVYLFGKIT